MKTLMVLTWFMVLAAVLVAAAVVPAEASLRIMGEEAPDFSLPYANADTVVFKALPLSEAVRNGPIVLAFYPADWSPGCTNEVCTFRDAFADMSGLHATIWGISGDTVFSHRAWIEHHHLPFLLFSDMKHDVARSYGVYNEQSGMNHRAVYVVGRDMRIAYADPEYSVQDDADFKALKEALAKMK